jgi:hypothetical protein
MKLNKVFAVLAVLAISASGAQAMFLGDYFQNAQTRLSYVVYKPSDTAGLKLTSFKMLECGAGLEQWIAIKYGSGKKFLEIYQNMSGKPCSDPGISKKLTNVKINTATAQVRVYCDPSKPAIFKKCTTAEIAKVGGYLMFTATNKVNMKATQIQVQGVGGITYKQLLVVAKSLKPMITSTVAPSGSQALPPVMIDPATTSEVSVRVTRTIVLTVTDPGNWSATIADPKIAKFVAGGDQGSYTTNPGITPLAVGSTTAMITGPDGKNYLLTITVTP